MIEPIRSRTLKGLVMATMKSFIYVSGPRMGTNNRMTGIVAPGEKPVKKTSIKKKPSTKKKGK